MNVKSKKVLLTGGTGKLGRAIIASGYFSLLKAPSHSELDITDEAQVENYFKHEAMDTVIHCAAMARVIQCQENPVQAMKTNIIGTSHLVAAVLKTEKRMDKHIRFIHISTDGVYEGSKGNYSETDRLHPYNHYGWTKLGAECAVHLLKNYCIIRTSFFDPKNISHETSAEDVYSSKLTLEELARDIAWLAGESFVGVINVGGERKSDFERYRLFKPQIKPCKLDDYRKTASIPLAQDASLNCNLWRMIQEKR